MGLATSSFLLGKGSPTTQMVNLITGSLYNSFIKETSEFSQFDTAFLDIYNTFNSALPGKHYDVPSNQEIKKCYEEWTAAGDNAEKKKQIFVDFIRRTVSLNKPQKMTLITGLVTPPAAMVAKKAGERVPALKIIKVVPDVLFVPTVTFLAIISAQVSRNVLHRRMVRRNEQRGQQNT